MPFGVTPATDQPVFPAERETVQTLNFIVNPARLLITRGVGENSHIVTLRIIPVVPP